MENTLYLNIALRRMTETWHLHGVDAGGHVACCPGYKMTATAQQNLDSAADAGVGNAVGIKTLFL